MFEPSTRGATLIEQMTGFLADDVYPAEDTFEAQLREGGDTRPEPPVMTELKKKASSDNYRDLRETVNQLKQNYET